MMIMSLETTTRFVLHSHSWYAFWLGTYFYEYLSTSIFLDYCCQTSFAEFSICMYARFPKCGLWKNLVSFQTSSGVFPFNQTSGTRLRMWAVVCTSSPHRFLGRLVAANMLRAISIIRFCCSMLCSEHYDVEYLWIILFRRDIFWNASDINSFALSDCSLCICIRWIPLGWLSLPFSGLFLLCCILEMLRLFCCNHLQKVHQLRIQCIQCIEWQ